MEKKFDALSFDLIKMWELGIEPNLYLYGSHDEAITTFIHNILDKIYKETKSNMVFQITSDFDIASTCDKIIQFCTFKSFTQTTQTKGLKKVLIIKQNNEKLNDSILSLLEEMNNVRLIIISNNIHTLTPSLKTNLVALMLPFPHVSNDTSNNSNNILHDYMNDLNVDEFTDIELCQKLENISDILNLNPSQELLDLYFSIA